MSAIQSSKMLAVALSFVTALTSAGCASMETVNGPDPTFAHFPKRQMPTDADMAKWEPEHRAHFERLRPIADELSPLLDVAQRRHLTDDEVQRVSQLSAQLLAATRSTEFQAIRYSEN